MGAKRFDHEKEASNLPSRQKSRWPWILGGGALVVILIGVLAPRPAPEPAGAPSHQSGAATKPAEPSSRLSRSRHGWALPAGRSAEEVVADKARQFARSRQEILHGLAKHLKFEVPAGFDKFLTIAESGNWEEIQQSFKSLMKARKENEWSEAASRLWPVITETYGVAEAAQTWPAQKLLDYGQAVLGSLRPDMVYVGGTEAGQFIPTLLNETSEGQRHIVLTQRALADASYLQYITFLYGDRLATLTAQDSQRSFENYLSDAQKRVQHDQQFPNEPRQIRPGEDVKIIDNRVDVSGQVAVMAINERLFQTLMDKNPGVSFAMEQSFPFESMYAGAVPLGPIMELRDQNG